LVVTLPEYEPVQIEWLDQGWTPDDTQWFYHASQGGAMGIPIPYDWFVNLEIGELPLLWWTDAGRLIDQSYMSRFGLLPNPRQRYDYRGLSEGWWSPVGSTLEEDQENNPDQLPVGFVKTLDYPDRRYKGGTDEEIGQVIPSVVGFNCSLCHTGQLNYQGRGIRIEGGPAMIELGQLERAVGNSLLLTRLLPPRFNRFAERVLGAGLNDTSKEQLEIQLEDLLLRAGALNAELARRNIYPTEEGFARLDAVGRIGNYVLGEEIDLGNLAVADAPVNFPQIWDTPWFEWVQYNASFKLPIMRNGGEAMGVFAAVNFRTIDDPDSLFSSSLNLPNLYEMEAMVRGDAGPFTGLRAPEWPDIFPAIDTAQARLGEKLYVTYCQDCHLPPFTQPDDFYRDEHWVEDQDRRYLRLNVVNLYAIGTDPEAARNMVARTAQIGRLGEEFKDTANVPGLVGMDATGMGGEVTFGLALPWVIEKVVQKKYDDLGLTDEERADFDGRRSAPYIQAPLGYKARPLNGVWATPPFLHNGSVQNIFELLGPEEKRDSIFWLGTKEYDPVLLGYVTGPVEGGFRFDTGQPGNSNKGHLFDGEDDPADPDENDCWKEGRRGLIGCGLDETERMQIIEFLKSLPSVPGGRPEPAGSGSMN
ncbi:MAG TPA: di-heme-cytochrome C peroxidase, partial [Longimicrobiales bacterium]|nr:di-heme-cytochrome C peroxidase [Longimicrobiales bacterium]